MSDRVLIPVVLVQVLELVFSKAIDLVYPEAVKGSSIEALRTIPREDVVLVIRYIVYGEPVDLYVIVY